MLEVAVEIDAADAILVQESVPVRVHSFGIERVRPRLAFRLVRPLHQSRIIRMQHEFSGRIEDTHERDQAVAIQVLTGILVEPSVVVVVVREPVSRRVTEDRREHRLRSIGVQSRHHVDHLARQHRCCARIVEEESDDLKGQLAPHHVIASKVTDHEHGRTLVHGNARRIADLDEPDLSTFVRRGDRTHARVPTAVR